MIDEELSKLIEASKWLIEAGYSQYVYTLLNSN